MKMWRFVLVCLMAYIQNALSNDCSPANVQNNLQSCLNGIWNKANDKSAFWYGSNWASICGYNPFAAPYCTVIQQPYTPHSLLNRVYGLDWNLTVNPLKQYLDVTYQTPTGTYPSCGNTYTVTESKTYELQPLLSKNTRPWDVRNIPTISWTALPNKLYTLYIFDTGSFIAHGLYININQNDIQNAEAIVHYHGPKNPTVRENAYVFMLFEQKNKIVLTNEWNQKLRQTMVSTAYNTTDAFEELDLIGPIAMNWLTAVKDPYSVQYFVNTGLINNCPNMVTEALKKKKVSFIPDAVDLSMSLDISLHTTALHFDSCCTSYRYQEHTAKLNPIGDGYISPARARSAATLTMTLLREGLLFMPSGNTDVRYTLLCVDISVPYPAAGTPDLPLMHMLVTNINGSDITSGDIIRSYLGPAPPDYVNHTYIFLLYTQTSMLNKVDTQSYLTQGCSAGIDGRCLFNVTRFVDGSNLKLVGSTWFQATTDEYIRYTYVNRGDDPDSVCNNINGYANPCPVTASNDCSPANIKNALRYCLDGIWHKANDKSVFWYGSNWASICGYNPFAAPYCTVIQQPYTPQSLLNRVYGLNWNLTVNPLKQYLDVTYQTPTGTYPSCGNTYTVTESKTFELQPLLSKNIHPWEARNIPTVTWTALPNKLYTLYIFDTGSFIAHALYININQNDIQNAEAIVHYRGPKNPTVRENVYVFMLFEQKNRIVLTNEWNQKLKQTMVSTSYNTTDAFEELDLTGPIAMNWLTAVKDPYSVQYFVNVGLINNCPNMVTEALKKKKVSFIPDDVDLSMSLDISLHTTALNFDSCCASYRYQEHTAKLNPIGDGYISPAHARSEATLTMTLLREGLLFMPSGNTDVRYTLLCVDISVPYPAAGTPDLPLMHMLVTNINGSDIASGDIIRSYLGPAPPDYVNHTYIFLLYTQTSMLNKVDTQSYLTQGCSAGIDGRCLFNVTRFVDGSNLKLIGSTWFQATTDEYIRYTYVNRGDDPDSVCNNINGYANPCPVTASNDCSPANIKNALRYCLDGIWHKANDKSAFWFGSNWASICGPNPFDAPYCTVIQQPYTPHSLLNTMYGLNWNLNMNPLKQYLHITYQSPTGSYQSCGNTYTVTESKTFKLEPLLSENTRPWDVQNFPTITWTALPNKLYTLFIFDAGAYINHGVFININQNDIQNSEIIKPYSNPKNPSIREQPYVFLLFEQTDRIALTDEWHQKLNQTMVKEAFNYTEVFQELNLTGPIAMNWLTAVKDPFVVQYWVNVNLINNCPNMVTDALKKKNISFIPDDVDLSMSLYINLHTTALNFESCCTSYRYQEHTAKLNPIGDGYISPAQARSEATLTMTLQREGILYIPSFKTDKHTLLCVDISVPYPAAGTPDLPLLHMLVTNINGNDVSSGDIIRSYRGPAPPDYVNHTYIFLLYTQSSMLKENETTSFLTQGCSSGIDGRCLFNVTRFVDGSNLKLVGSTWFQATTDEYIRYTYVNRGDDPDSVCNNIKGYGNPCPVGSTVIVKSSMLSVVALCILAYISFTK